MPAHAKLVGLLTFVLAVVSLPRGAHWPLLGMLAVAVGVLASTRVPFSLLLPRMVVEVPFVVFALVMPFVALGPRVQLGPLEVSGPDRLGLLTRTLLTRRIRMQGFIVFDDYGTRYGEFFSQMSTWLKVGKIKFREDIVDGLENAPHAFIGLLEGRNFGKLIIRVGSD